MASVNSPVALLRRHGRGAIAMAAALIALAGCAGGDRETGPPTLAGVARSSAPSRPATPPGAVPGFKIGKPYQVNGIAYQPGFNWTYEEVGIASWYGSQFHGLATANGERFDMNTLSAAHRTLPLPSIVQVTNLENGRTIRVRVNDRGPFANDRILDLSRHGAQLLGFERKGTTRVRVKLIADESMRLAGLDPAIAKAAASPAGRPAHVLVATATAAPAVAPVALAATTQASGAGATVTQAASPGERAGYRVYAAKAFIQAGAFADRENASRAGAELAHLAPVKIVYNGFDGRNLFRVRLGPLDSAETERVLADAIRAGYSGSRVIME